MWRLRRKGPSKGVRTIYSEKVRTFESGPGGGWAGGVEGRQNTNTVIETLVLGLWAAVGHRVQGTTLRSWSMLSSRLTSTPVANE
ncbi:Lateral signaling target protein 2 [Clarias magur]|uniref:Lateral signaling target protein 2 n=1 Tax=Clarias magur TaxID=1594786 RepID=A0A8J4THN5_CLAMG|nr:Lateral signaling target protein 2 [Clarias magur]